VNVCVVVENVLMYVVSVVNSPSKMFSRSATRMARSVQLQSRSFSAAAKREPVELPAKLFGLGARYANALFTSAVRAKALPNVESDLKALAQIQKESPVFAEYLKNPIIPFEEKAADMDKVSAGMCDTTRGFLNVVAQNNRLGELNKILRSFQLLLNAQRGIVEATVTSSEDLSAKQLKSIEQAISSGYLSDGQSLNLTVKVAPAILGGLQIQVGDKFLDLSVASSINNIQKVLV